MQKIKEVLLSNRFKSFYWRTGAMALASFISLISESLTGFGLSGQSVVVLGLILGELTKAINNFANQKGA